MKIWILFAHDGDDVFVDTVFYFEQDAIEAKKSRETVDTGLSYHIDWFEVR